MNASIVQKSKSNTTPHTVIDTPPCKRGLVATWIKVEGKLVCVWSIPSSQELFKSTERDRTTRTTVNKSPIQPASLTVVSTNSRKNRLIAQWVTVDGKLVCKWITQEPSISTKPNETNISQLNAA